MYEKVFEIIQGICVAKGHGKAYATRIKNGVFRYINRWTNSQKGREEFVRFIRDSKYESEDFIRRSHNIGNTAIEVFRETTAIINEWGI